MVEFRMFGGGLNLRVCEMTWNNDAKLDDIKIDHIILTTFKLTYLLDFEFGWIIN